MTSSIITDEIQSNLLNKIFSSNNNIFDNLTLLQQKFQTLKSLNLRPKIKKKSLKSIRKNSENLKRNRRFAENELFYKNYFSILDVKNNELRQYCGEALYYLVEYYCVFIKGTSVYSPDSDVNLVNVISRRETNDEETVYNSGGIVNECCYRACRPDQLEKYCN
ncbi:unnamed protein product [Brachionus calyciflorus]|uniref:Insulin-like domain-containing protein n=1 Tax=Brachionus calyciflorus TaxID=104777 RepID=A0A813M3S3_9BILA|nr:unnamed protein product [Brachionus calyciflorus]